MVSSQEANRLVPKRAATNSLHRRPRRRFLLSRVRSRVLLLLLLLLLFCIFFFKIREFFSILFCFFSSQTTKYPLELLPPQSDFQGKKNFSPFSGSRTAEDNGTWFHGTTSTGGTAGTRNGRVIDFGVSATFDETSAFVDGLVPYGDIP